MIFNQHIRIFVPIILIQMGNLIAQEETQTQSPESRVAEETTPLAGEEAPSEELPYPPDAGSQSPFPLLKVGDVEIHPHFGVNFLYDDNIFIRPSNMEDDFITVFSPGILFAMGNFLGERDNYIGIDYTPNLIFFADNDSLNAVDHELLLDAQRLFSKWTIRLKHSFQTLSGTVVDIGGRVSRKIFTTGLFSRLDMTDKTSLEINGSHILSDYDSFAQFDSQEWINQNWFNYQLYPKTVVGAGVTLGFLDVTQNPDQTYQQWLIRWNYSATEKIGFRLSGGLETRQFDSSASDRLTPIFSIGSTYQPFDATRISIDAYRRIQNSAAIIGENIRVTGISAAIRQRIFQKGYLGLSGGFENLAYDSYIPGIASSREDDYFFLQPSFDYEFNENASIGVYYIHRENNSSLANVAFDNNQVGIKVSVRF
jgi:hypothetical protein